MSDTPKHSGDARGAQHALSLIEVEYAIGFGACCAWILVAVQFESEFFTLVQDGMSIPSPSIAMYGVSGITFLFFALYGRTQSSKLVNLFSRPQFRWTVCCILCVFTALLHLSQQMTAGFAFAILSELVIGVGIAIMVLCWALLFTRLNYRELVISNVLSFFFNVLLLFASYFSVIYYESWIYAFLPLISILILTHVDKKGDVDSGDEDSEAPRESDDSLHLKQPMFEKADYAHERSVMVRFFLCVVIYFFVGEATRFISEDVVLPSSMTFSLAGLAIAIVSLITLVLLLQLFIHFPAYHKVNALYRMSFMILLVSVLLLPFSLWSSQLSLIVYILNQSSYQCFSIVVLLASILHGQLNGRLLPTVAWCQVGWATGGFCGLIFGTRIGALFGQEFAYITAFGCICTILLFSCIAFLFTDRSILHFTRPDPIRNKQDYYLACKNEAERVGLTKREEEVLILLADGKKSVDIQQELFLSSSTVNTHRYHIYKKCNVKSQAELVNRIEKIRKGYSK